MMEDKKHGNRWRGGKHKCVHGYIHTKNPNYERGKNRFYIREHRLVMSKYLGRPLKEDEYVHHINEDRTDNRIDNLKLMTRAEHVSLHHNGVKKNMENYPKCLGCNKKTRSKYQLCTKHYRTQWQRVKNKIIKSLLDLSKINKYEDKTN